MKRLSEAVLYSIFDPIIVIDEFDKLLMANDAAAKLFNFTYKSSRKKNIIDLVWDAENETGKNEFVNFLCQTRRAKARHTRHTIDFSNGDGAKTFDCIVSPVYGNEGRICGAVAVLRDITRERQISQMKNDFVSHVSHELKTPLASISAYSEMLVDGEADDEKTRKEFYSVIQSQAKRLNRLIEDTLNISRIESGLIKVEKKPVSMAMLIEEHLPMMKSCAAEKHITITGQAPVASDWVCVDKDMISQVVVNLLGNAVKYTPDGGSINIQTDVDEITGVVRVSISDTGVGIAEDEIGHIFDRFYRVGKNSKQANGTGLGLNLVKQIVEKVHSGRVFVISKPDVGSTFGFELPLAAAEAVTV